LPNKPNNFWHLPDISGALFFPKKADIGIGLTAFGCLGNKSEISHFLCKGIFRKEDS
jgi:hypothetical protein